jgi:hypothetical protein
MALSGLEGTIVSHTLAEITNTDSTHTERTEVTDKEGGEYMVGVKQVEFYGGIHPISPNNANQ